MATDIIFKTEFKTGQTGAKGDAGTSFEVPTGGIIAYDGATAPEGYEVTTDPGGGGGSNYNRDVLFHNTGTTVSEITTLAHPLTSYDEVEFIIGTTQSGAQMAYRFDVDSFMTTFPYVADTSTVNFPFFAPSLFNGNYMMRIIMGETSSEIKCFTASLEYFVEIAGISY